MQYLLRKCYVKNILHKSICFLQVAKHFDVTLSNKYWMMIALVPILFSALIRNLKYLTPLSMAANCCMISGIIITFYFTSSGLPHPRERDYVASPALMPLYFGTAIFAFEGIGLVSII